MSRSVVAMNAQGRVTLPASARRKLGLTEGVQLEVAVDESSITLRPTRLVPAEDAWAYTPESIASIQRALADVRAGRIYQLSPDDLLTGNYPRRRPARARRRAR